MEPLRQIIDFMNGKSREFIEDAIESGTLSFDPEKYEIKESEKKMSGYKPGFTKKYKREMNLILGGIKADNDVYIKLDSLLTDGYEFSDVYEEMLYPDRSSIYRGFEKQNALVFCFKKDSISGEDDSERQVIVANGKLVKGSISMATYRSDYYERVCADVIDRQDYIMDMFDVNRETAAYITTMLHKYDEDRFEDTAEQMYNFIYNSMMQISIQPENAKHIEDFLLSKSRMKISEALIRLAGSNDVYEKLLRTLTRSRWPYKWHAIQDIVIGGMRKEISFILKSGNIEKYRDFAEKAGKYPGGFTHNVRTAAEIAGMDKELREFLMKHGDEDDLSQYMRKTFYDPEKQREYVLGS